MKTPPLLLFAALLFWGWQSGLLVVGAAAGAALEAARILRGRWDLEDVDFNRIWSFCVLVMVAWFGYLFTTGDQGGGAAMAHGAAAVRNASASSTSVMRWLPLICFPLVAAQVYNARPTVPVTAVSLVLRLRRRRGEQSLAGRYLDVTYPYFIVCVFSAGIHTNQGTHTYFWGLGVLILWALWNLRSQRFGVKAWAGGLAVVMALGFAGQLGVNALEVAVQNFDARFLARFFRSSTDPSQSVTSLGQVGELELSPRIVIWLQPGILGMAPSYLREASYHSYNARSRTWAAGGINDFLLVPPQPDGSSWELLPGKTAKYTVNIACYLEGRSESVPEGVLPLPSGAGWLSQLPSYTSIQTNKLGAVLATGPGLAIFDVRYGPGATLDSPPDADTNHWDLRVPIEETNALAQVIAGLHLAGASDLEKRLAVQRFFERNFTYSAWQGRDKVATTNASPLTRFLLTSRSGHCEYFATATVLLLRQLGIPARYAVGYYVHEPSGAGYVVRERDAHAWCLVWDRDHKAWEDFDTTPSSWVGIEERNASVLDALSDLRSWLGFQFEKFLWRQANLRQYILWTLSPVMAVLLYYIIFQRRAHARAAGKKADREADIVWPGHDSAFYRLESSLAARGVPRRPQEPLSDWLERMLTEPALAGFRAPLRELLRLHYRYRFDPHGLDPAEKAALAQNAQTILAGLTQLHRGQPAAA